MSLRNVIENRLQHKKLFLLYIYNYKLLILKSSALFILTDIVQLYRRKFCAGHILLVIDLLFIKSLKKIVILVTVNI